MPTEDYIIEQMARAMAIAEGAYWWKFDETDPNREQLEIYYKFDARRYYHAHLAMLKTTEGE